MSRIGKKPIALAKGVKYTVEGNTVVVEGPKGKVTALIAKGITLETDDGTLHVDRSDDKDAAFTALPAHWSSTPFTASPKVGSASSTSSALVTVPS